MTILAFIFAGWGVSTLLAWGLGLGLLVTGLYLLRIRRKRVVVPFVEGWRELVGPRRKTALKNRLRHVGSLLLQLLLLALLLLVLGDPRPEREGADARSLVCLLDVSASMAEPSAAGATGESRFSAAQRSARELIGSLGPRDRLLIIEMGAKPGVKLGFSADRAALERTVQMARVLDTPADLGAALALADDALRGRPHGEIVVLSDGALDLRQLPPISSEHRLVFHGLGPHGPQAERLDNVALTSFAARRYPLDPAAFEVLAVVQNSSPRAVDVELTLEAVTDDARGGTVIDVARLHVDAGDSLQHVRASLTGAGGRLRARVRRLDGARDGLRRDDVAYALLPAPRKARVLVVGAENTFLDAALLVEPGLEISHVSRAAYPPAGDFDITIFDGAYPQRVARSGAALYLGMPSDEVGYPLKIGKELHDFGFDHWLAEEPLFRFLDPYDIQVLKGRELLAGPKDRVLARSDQGALLVEGRGAEGRFVALGFDPRDSDFALRVAFPIFILNALDHLLGASHDAEFSDLTTGRVARLPLPTITGGNAHIEGPLGDAPRAYQVPALEGIALFEPERAGFYRASLGSTRVEFAASLVNAQESALAPRSELAWGARRAEPLGVITPHRDAEPWLWLLAVGLLLAVVEWLTFHRRWTV